jgi:uncharacterized protein with NRDE domain
MCLIAIARNASPKFPLVIAANRDELYARPTLPAGVWEDDARIVGGRDVRAGGTWLALRRGGRFGAITNVRGIGRAEGGPSRGTLVSDFVRGDDEPMAYAKSIKGSDYAGFHLIVGDDEIVHASNPGPLGTVDGVFAISNAPPGSEWEKVTVARDFLAEAVAQTDDTDALANSLLHFLSQKRGGPIEREIFVASETYGTRSSTVIVADAFGDFLLAEQNYRAGGERDGEPRRYRLPFMT